MRSKKVTSTLPQNHPKKELANKKAIFECKILNIKSPKKINLMMILQKN